MGQGREHYGHGDAAAGRRFTAKEPLLCDTDAWRLVRSQRDGHDQGYEQTILEKVWRLPPARSESPFPSPISQPPHAILPSWSVVRRTIKHVQIFSSWRSRVSHPPRCPWVRSRSKPGRVRDSSSRPSSNRPSPPSPCPRAHEAGTADLARSRRASASAQPHARIRLAHATDVHTAGVAYHPLK